MKTLIDFFVKHSSWFLFAFYVIVSSALLFQNNPYQQSVYLTSANAISSTVYEGISAVTSYFNLHDINDDLQQRNAQLELEVINLRNELDNMKMQMPDSNALQPALKPYEYVLAQVISNSIAQSHNYITIDRGSADGIKPGMGVVDRNGVIGMVNVVGKHSARVISMLNPDMKLSCSIRDTEFFGTMIWDGGSPLYAILQELPKHGNYNKGDTVITNGYSATFPKGIIVGVVESVDKQTGGNYVSLRVRLTANFSQLSTVRVFKNTFKTELEAIKRDDVDDENNEKLFK